MMYYNTDGVEEIEEVDVDVKGVIPVNEQKYISRALEIAGEDITFVTRKPHAPDTPSFRTKAIVMPYKIRGRNRNAPEIPDYAVGLGEFNDDAYYLICAAGVLMGIVERVMIRNRLFVVVRTGERFLHNDVLYEWAVIQSVESLHDNTYYDPVA